MTSRLARLAWSAWLTGLLVVPAVPAAAATIFLRAGLDGGQEVPPTSSAATGAGSFSYNDATGVVTFGIFVSGLEGTETAAQIRGPAEPGANAPSIFSLPLGNVKSGTLTLTAAQGADLLAGLWYVNVATTAFADGEIRGQIAQAFLVAAVLPSSRSVPVGVPATAFATIANTGPSPATGCGLALASAIPATFSHQTTNPATNTVTGTPGTPVDIPLGGSQTFVFAITPTAPIPSTEVQLRFTCANAPPVSAITGVNTLLLSATAAPVADVIATVLSPLSPTSLSTPGVLVVDATSHQGAFGVSALNVGASDTLTVTADTGAAALPLAIALCQTSIATADCASPAAPSVAIAMAGGAGAGLAVFVTATGQVPSNAAVNRIFVRFRDASGVTRGSTSIAVRADPAPSTFLRAGLDGAQHVPPTSSAASGFGFFTYDDATRQMTFFMVVSNLQGAETAAAIRGPALPGANAPVIFSLPLGSPKSGALTLTAAQADDLLAGLWYVSVSTTAFPGGEIRGQIGQALLTSAVLPGSRSVQVGVPATAFATIVNAGPGTATNCGIALTGAVPATLTYQTTNPATNTVTGTPNASVDIASGASRTFVIALTPTAPFAPTEVRLGFDCDNSPPAPTFIGVNTLLLSASGTPVPDVIAIALAAGGALGLDPPSRQGAFAVAAVNIGASASLAVTADTGGAALPVTIALCQTSLSGACVNPPAASAAIAMNGGAGAGLAVFVTATGAIRANAAVNRVFVRFKDARGVTRGSTSVAIDSR